MMYSGFPYQVPQFQQPAVDIGQVGNEQEAVNAYVAAGRSKIMFSSDDQTVYVKCVSMNGQVTMDIFDRRPPTPTVGHGTAAPDYVTREELKEMLDALKSPKKGVKTEVANEPV